MIINGRCESEYELFLINVAQNVGFTLSYLEYCVSLRDRFYPKGLKQPRVVNPPTRSRALSLLTQEVCI